MLHDWPDSTRSDRGTPERASRLELLRALVNPDTQLEPTATEIETPLGTLRLAAAVGWLRMAQFHRAAASGGRLSIRGLGLWRKRRPWRWSVPAHHLPEDEQTRPEDTAMMAYLNELGMVASRRIRSEARRLASSG